MIDWFNEHKLVIGKSITTLLLLSYLWSVAFKLFIGMDSSIWQTAPWYAFQFVTYSDPNVIKKLILSGGLTALILAGLIAASLRQRYLSKLYGDAHWASEAEIKKAGLRTEDGVIIGRTGTLNKRYLIAGENHNIAVIAPPRSGKGISFVIPNNLNWNGSIITLDVRGEAYKETSGFRAQYSDVFILDFLNEDGHTHRFNPLDLVDKHNRVTRFSQIDKVASKLWPPESDKGEIWQPEARTLFNALALMLVDLGSERFTLGEINRILMNTTDLVPYFEAILDKHRNQLDPATIMGLNGFLQKSPKEASGVVTTLKSGLSLWLNPIIDAATSSSDFDIRDLRKKRISIYMVTKPGDIGRLGKLIALFFEQIVEAMTQQKPEETTEPHKLLLLMDEFTLLPKMGILEKGVAFLSGYNIITMPVIQAFSQLESVYGKAGADTFIQTHKYRIIYAQNDEHAAQRISNALGTRTMRSYSHSHRASSMSGTSTSQSYIKRELMMPHEVMRIPKDKEVIMIEGSAPLYCNKANFLQDKRYTKRIQPPIDKPEIDLQGFIRSVKTLSINVDIDDKKSNDDDLSDEEFAALVESSIEDY